MPFIGTFFTFVKSLYANIPPKAMSAHWVPAMPAKTAVSVLAPSEYGILCSRILRSSMYLYSRSDAFSSLRSSTSCSVSVIGQYSSVAFANRISFSGGLPLASRSRFTVMYRSIRRFPSFRLTRSVSCGINSSRHMISTSERSNPLYLWTALMARQ